MFSGTSRVLAGMYDTASLVSSSYKASESTSLLSKDIPSQFPKQWPQHLAALLASSAALGSGCVAGWSAPAIPYLQGHLGTLNVTPVTDNQASWIGSIITLGALTGAMPAGKLAGLFGRKWFLIFLAFPLICGWLTILLGYKSVYMIYLGRFICGVSFGAITVAVPMYNNEIAEDNVRGVMGVYFDFMWCVGILWAYVMGAYTSFYWLTLSGCIMPIIFVITFIFMPESPVYLIVNGQKEAAENSLRWLRNGNNKDVDVTFEMEKLQQMINEAEIRAKTPKSSPKITNFETLKMSFQEFIGSVSTKAVIIGMGLMTFQRLSGVSAIVYYTVDIFRGAGTKIPPEFATIAVGVVSVIASGTSALFIDRIGRKFLLVLSGSAMSLSLATMTVYFVFKTQGMNMEAVSWVPIIVICVFIGTFRAGYGPIPWLMTAEILPNEVKLWAYSVIVCYAWLLTFLLTKLFPVIINIVGQEVVYGVLSIINFIGVWFSACVVPETKCKSAEQIRQAIERKMYSSEKLLYADHLNK